MESDGLLRFVLRWRQPGSCSALSLPVTVQLAGPLHMKILRLRVKGEGV